MCLYMKYCSCHFTNLCLGICFTNELSCCKGENFLSESLYKRIHIYFHNEALVTEGVMIITKAEPR